MISIEFKLRNNYEKVKKTKKVSKVKKKTAVKKASPSKSKQTAREKMIGQHIGYRYDVNLLPDYKKITPFLKKIY